MADQTIVPSNSTEDSNHPSIRFTELLGRINKFMPKKTDSAVVEEKEEEEEETQIETNTELPIVDVTKLTLKEKRQALKLLKERQLLNEFELAKKNEMICEQVNNKEYLILEEPRKRNDF